ncbi:PspC domain-containing protein [Rhodococcus sp. IEGM 1401]|uniref:PspC domain-containing protein n=1 Tax=unclassified Rhodococcus (in: high G+C Gram-positive bacteria) TaxID=192944 RepID=UPI0022B3D8DD|nr:MULTISPECIES: PspC domain-containing protein [unclassified Rhodococcus (in: high G+C Gram-positive bacteria)]MCZ4560742.1 PspC domain-containing protein [Rhodococcus sp. IEGM 1401]MDI9920870.1 PspC domain-containing protein [Rhodococcus sp. IEGM 1372]MDV8033093.1 PspC domain-containing protein [Rhodococcus sp. IEGM 1414]
MSNVTVSDQLQQMWRTRPHRLPQRGHVAGVAAGIGYRYDVDPVLIRIAFVVSTLFGGTGIVLYLAGWLVLNRAGDTASGAESLVGRGNSSDSTTKMVVVAVALVIAVSTIGPVGVGLGGSGLISLVAMLGGLWLLHQRCPEPPPYMRTAEFSRNRYAPMPFGSTSTSAEQWTAAQYRPPQFQHERYTPYTTLPKSYVPTPKRIEHNGIDADALTVNLSKSTASAEKPADLPTDLPTVTPPSWDPLGVAPFAWDLPEPAGTFPPAAIERKRRSRWTASFLGLALLAAAVTAAVGSATGGDWASPGRVGAVALAVISVGLVLGAFLRKGYGLLVVAAPLAGFVVLASAVGPVDLSQRNSGNQLFAPISAADLEPSYTNALGNVTLNLGAVTLTEDRRVAIDVTAGNATITVPDTMNIDVQCSATLGTTDCGLGGIQIGSAATADAPVLTIDANATLGNIEVKRA